MPIDTSVGIVDAAGATRQIDAIALDSTGDLRQFVIVGDDSGARAPLLTSEPVGTEAGLVVRHTGPAPAGRAGTIARAQIVSATTSTAVWAARAGRRGGSLCNRSNGEVFIGFQATVTLDNADVVIPPGGLYELPMTSNLRITDAVSVIWASAVTGTLRTVEWF
jgi:hypothetical protein